MPFLRIKVEDKIFHTNKVEIGRKVSENRCHKKQYKVTQDTDILKIWKKEKHEYLENHKKG